MYIRDVKVQIDSKENEDEYQIEANFMKDEENHWVFVR